jgi:hypothetical protein
MSASTAIHLFICSPSFICFIYTQIYVYIHSFLRNKSQGSSVGIGAGYGLDGRGVGVRVPVRARIFTSPRRPDLFWGPPVALRRKYMYKNVEVLEVY